MATVNATVRRTQIKNDGKVNIKIRIFHEDSARYIATKFNVPFDMFSIPDGKVKRSHPQSGFINKELKILEARYEAKIMEMDDLDIISVSQLVSRLKRKPREIVNLINLFSERIDELKKHPDKTTWRTYNNTKLNLISFAGREFIPLVAVDEHFLEKFTAWHLKKENSVNTAGIELRNIRAI